MAPSPSGPHAHLWEVIEYKSEYGKTILCGHASISGYKIGIVANQKKIVKTADGKIQLGGVIYK